MWTGVAARESVEDESLEDELSFASLASALFFEHAAIDAKASAMKATRDAIRGGRIMDFPI
jgi:hypothetical protein